MLVFASSRTFDLMSIALRMAGFITHPMCMWAFGSGFPKATNLSKQLDKDAGMEREVVSENPAFGIGGRSTFNGHSEGATAKVSLPASAAAPQWDGWYYGRQSLKPAFEPICMVQKPAEGRMVDNVLKWGTGAVNVDGCRVATEEIAEEAGKGNSFGGTTIGFFAGGQRRTKGNGANNPSGRWPANLVHDGSDEVTALFPETGGNNYRPNARVEGYSNDAAINYVGKRTFNLVQYSDTGSAARFFNVCPFDEDDYEVARLFYCAKASKDDRDEGLDGMPVKGKVFNGQSDTPAGMAEGSVEDKFSTLPSANFHPTTKPLSLMRHLCKLITPPGGTVLDCFLGSGSTGKAAILEGFRFVGIELDAEYMEIAEKRIGDAARQKRGEFKILTDSASDFDGLPMFGGGE